STTNAKSCDIALRLNTDLLTPLNITGNGFFGNLALATTPVISKTQDNFSLHFDLPNESVVPSGVLCEVQCVAFVTKTLSTPITLARVTFNDASGSSKCLSVQSTADSVTAFVLDRQCGDTTLARVIRTNQLIIDRIAPNPTTGHVTISCRAFDYHNDAVIE